MSTIQVTSCCRSVCLSEMLQLAQPPFSSWGFQCVSHTIEPGALVVVRTS